MSEALLDVRYMMKCQWHDLMPETWPGAGDVKWCQGQNPVAGTCCHARDLTWSQRIDVVPWICDRDLRWCQGHDIDASNMTWWEDYYMAPGAWKYSLDLTCCHGQFNRKWCEEITCSDNLTWRNMNWCLYVVSELDVMPWNWPNARNLP